MMDIDNIAEKCGAEIGTWDKSGNGQKLIAFTRAELKAYTNEIIERCAIRGRLAQLESKVVDIEICNLKG